MRKLTAATSNLGSRMGQEVSHVSREVSHVHREVSRTIGQFAGNVADALPADHVAAEVSHVAAEASRIIGTIGVSIGVLGTIVTDPAQLKRLVELIQTNDFPGLVRALTSRGGAHFPPNYFPDWMRNAGGYFPKFAQVLSVRADLIHDREVLDGLSRCLEDMPERDVAEVRRHLRQRCGWDEAACERVGLHLNTGSVAQVNKLALPDGTQAVVKVTWPETRKKMETDFRLFVHARKILKALHLSDEAAQTTAAMFDAVGKSETAVLAEFDLLREADALYTADELCGRPWNEVYSKWQAVILPEMNGIPPLLAPLVRPWNEVYSKWQAVILPEMHGIPPLLAPLVRPALQQALAWRTRVPTPLEGYSHHFAIGMTFAGGESMQKLLQGDAGPDARKEAAAVFVGYVVPFIGWLLLCKSASHLAHVDPHPANFRWDAGAQTLWVLDWGSHIRLSVEQCSALGFLISLVADDGDDALIHEAAQTFGIRGSNDHQLANVIRGLLNASPHHAAQDALNGAGVDNMLQDVSEEIVPVVRCLSILGGMLKNIQGVLLDQTRQQIPLSLATLWKPFYLMS